MEKNEKLLINGGNPLFGKIDVDTSKNALLPILAGSIMCSEKVVIKKVTYYEDINNMIAILEHLGTKVCKREDMLILDSTGINKWDIPFELANKLRASIFFLGPLVSRLSKARVAYPGGCCIGARPIDIHIAGLKKLGAKINDKHGVISVNGENMKSNSYCLSFPSVGATENLIMASVFFKGETILYGTAKEPEVVDLCNFLNKMGAKIFGAGTDEIHIHGVEKLHGGEYSPLPDRIVAGTYLLAPLICGGEIELGNICSKHIKPILDLVSNNACKICLYGDKMLIKRQARPKGFGKIETMPYPFFPTDLQQPFCTLASLARGNTIIVENLFENRFNHVPELIKMGAKITIKDRTAVIEGVSNLYGANVEAPDLRGGVALVLAGLGADGYTTIANAQIINRGYYNLAQKLNYLGANIKLIN